ncbi:MAG: AAA family ATPase, partial [Acidimicrobiia bacterium]
MDARRVPDAATIHGARHVDLSRWPLVGREDELDLATSALASGSSVVLTGAAGVGKTRLAHEVLARVAQNQDRTEWVAATQSAASVPLGPVAHLVADASIGGGRDATLRRIVAALHRDDGTRLILGIDDAHLLDDASAALVQLLVAGGSASAVVTVRSGEPTPDAIASIWKDGPAPLVALQALARAEVETVVTTALHDPIDGATLQFLWDSSRGNALFLREVVHHGVESGALRWEAGLWRWTGPLEPSERLYNIVSMRMGTLDDSERTALELVAVGQPLTIECLRRLGNSDVVEDLERRGLVTAEPQRGVVALAHPLFGEILRDRMPATRHRDVLIELADALDATCDGSPSDHMRIALWRVDAGDQARPDQMRDAAGRALRLWEPVVAERLARAALDAEPDMLAAYLLGAALSDQNRADESLDAFRTARSLDGPDRLRAAVATDEAGVLSHQLGRLADAERVLDETLELVSDSHARAVLEGGRAAIVVSAGHATTGDPEHLSSGAPTAAVAAVIESTAGGRLDLAVRIAEERLATASQWTAEFPAVELYFGLAQSWALGLRGDLEDALELADAAYATALEDGLDFPRVSWCMVRGMILVTRGRPTSATRALLEGLAAFEILDRGFLKPTHAYLSMASSLLGDVAASEQHLRAAHDAMASYDGVFGVDVGRAGAWLRAACGEISNAADEAKRVAADAGDRNAWALEATALHDAARFGRAADVVDRLQELTDLVDGPLVDCLAAHARALVDGDGTALDAVSRSFSSLTFDLFAAESSAAAAREHRRAGKRSSAHAALERARKLHDRCESADTPALDWAEQPEALTAREREVADLA